MAGYRYLAAIRSRLLSSPELVAFVGSRVYHGHIFDIAEPVYPLVTFMTSGAEEVVWAPNTINDGILLVQCYTKTNLEDAQAIETLVSRMLHTEKNRTSAADACFHGIRKVWGNSGLWNKETSSWQISARYEFHVTSQ